MRRSTRIDAQTGNVKSKPCEICDQHIILKENTLKVAKSSKKVPKLRIKITEKCPKKDKRRKLSLAAQDVFLQLTEEKDTNLSLERKDRKLAFLSKMPKSRIKRVDWRDIEGMEPYESDFSDEETPGLPVFGPFWP